MSKFIDWLYGKNRFLFYKVLETRSLLTLGSSRKATRNYLNTAAVPMLQLGSGRSYLQNWLNTDYFGKPPRFVYLNAAKKFHLPDSSFERIYSEHMIEHINQHAGMSMLLECFRILKPLGRIRIETPDMRKICSIYHEKDPASLEYINWHNSEYGIKGYPSTVCFTINNAFRNWGHQFLYDEEMLSIMMAKAGFENIKRYDWNETDAPLFKGLSQRPYDKFESSLNDTVVLEADKP